MTNKPNITPTPVGELITDLIPVIENKGSISYCYLKEALYKAKQKEDLAVNCTYGANINPEKIQELIQSLEDILIQYNGVGIVNEKWVEETIAEALNNIKYK